MIQIFANSTFYTSMADKNTTSGVSSLDLMTKNLPDQIDGCWINGLTIMNVKKMLPLFLKERFRKNWVILNVGSVECFSNRAANFLHWCCQYINYYGIDSYFQSFVFPKMLLAAKDVTEKKESFYQIMLAHEFGIVLEDVLRMLEGFSVIVIGINHPHMDSVNAEMFELACRYRDVLFATSKKFDNVVFIDSWNMFSEYVVDTTHLTQDGHFKMFDLIQSLIEGRKI